MENDDDFSLIYKNIGIKISSYRKKRGWTQEKLSKIANVSRARISDIECGKGNFYFESILYIAKALGIDYRFFLDEDNDFLIKKTVRELLKELSLKNN